MARLTGTWTKPGQPLPSSHLIRSVDDTKGYAIARLRCGRRSMILSEAIDALTPEPPARGRTCESCLRYSRRDG